MVAGSRMCAGYNGAVIRILLCLLFLCRAGAGSVMAEPGAVKPPTVGAQIAQGEAFARKTCARCHATGRQGQSPHTDAPPFREIAQRYPVWSLAEALAEGIVTGHPDMPEFQLEPDEIGAFLSYLETLSRAPGQPENGSP